MAGRGHPARLLFILFPIHHSDDRNYHNRYHAYQPINYFTHTITFFYAGAHCRNDISRMPSKSDPPFGSCHTANTLSRPMAVIIHSSYSPCRCEMILSPTLNWSRLQICADVSDILRFPLSLFSNHTDKSRF